MTQNPNLKQQLAALKAKEPKLRTRDLAARLGVSEVEVVSLSVGKNVTRLSGNWKCLLKGLKNLGEVMALTRNEHCVHERKGVYDNVEFYSGPHNMGVAVNPDIDLRFFMNEWVYGLAVDMDLGKRGILHGIQFYNKRGEAVHKIYTTPKSNVEAFHQVVKLFAAEDQVPITDVDRTPPSPKTILPDEEIDISGFQQAWRDLKDTHEFFGLLRKYKVTRTQGFRLAPEGFSQKVNQQAVIQTLEAAKATKTPIMCFVHSKGCVQIHTGPVKNLKTMGNWYNVLDPKFNLHLNLDSIAETWVIKKPTADGIVTSLELFDANGELIVYFFGARKPGIPELEAWRSIIAEVSESSLV